MPVAEDASNGSGPDGGAPNGASEPASPQVNGEAHASERPAQGPASEAAPESEASSGAAAAATAESAESATSQTGSAEEAPAKSSLPAPGRRALKPGDCVWAKYASHAWWPAKVLARDSPIAQWVPLKADGEECKVKEHKDTEHCCHFFGSHDWSWIPEARICHFDEGFMKYSKKCRTKLFKKALDEAKKFVHEGIEPEEFEVTDLSQVVDVSQPSSKKRRLSNAVSSVSEEPEDVEEVVPEPERVRRRQQAILVRLGLRPPPPLAGK